MNEPTSRKKMTRTKETVSIQIIQVLSLENDQTAIAGPQENNSKKETVYEEKRQYFGVRKWQDGSRREAI